MKANKVNFSELQSLLRAEADQVPHRDLGDSFLDDLHKRIESKPKQKSLCLRLPEFPKFAWVSATFAALALGLFLGFGLGKGSDTSTLSETSSTEKLLLVSTDTRIVEGGVIPHYAVKPLEF